MSNAEIDNLKEKITQLASALELAKQEYEYATRFPIEVEGGKKEIRVRSTWGYAIVRNSREGCDYIDIDTVRSFHEDAIKAANEADVWIRTRETGKRSNRQTGFLQVKVTAKADKNRID